MKTKIKRIRVELDKQTLVIQGLHPLEKLLLL